MFETVPRAWDGSDEVVEGIVETPSIGWVVVGQGHETRRGEVEDARRSIGRRSMRDALVNRMVLLSMASALSSEDAISRPAG